MGHRGVAQPIQVASGVPLIALTTGVTLILDHLPQRSHGRAGTPWRVSPPLFCSAEMDTGLTRRSFLGPAVVGGATVRCTQETPAMTDPPPTLVPSGSIPVNGLEMCDEIHGDGGVSLLLLHGFTHVDHGPPRDGGRRVPGGRKSLGLRRDQHPARDGGQVLGLQRRSALPAACRFLARLGHSRCDRGRVWLLAVCGTWRVQVRPGITCDDQDPSDWVGPKLPR